MTIDDQNRSYFVANVRQLRWQENELGATCSSTSTANASPNSASI